MSSSTTTTMMITMLMSMTLSRTCTSSSACRRFSCSTVSVLFSASLFQQLPRASFYARRDLAADKRDPQPFLLKNAMLMDPIGFAVVDFCGDAFFLRSSIRCFLSSFLCSRRRRRSSKRASPVSSDNRDDGVSIPFLLFARSRTPSCSTFILFFLFVSFVPVLLLFLLLSFPSLERSSFLFWTKFNAKSVVVFKDTLLFCDDDILGDDIRFRRFR